MGLERVVAIAPPSIAEINTRLAGIGVVVMVDNRFLAAGEPPLTAWSDLRVRTPAGTLSLVRRADGVAIVVFGNADEALRATQERIAEVLSAPG